MDCPFCGAQDICVGDDDTHDFCNECGARGPLRGDGRGGWNELGKFTWNTRVENLALVDIRGALELAQETLSDLLGMIPNPCDKQAAKGSQRDFTQGNLIYRAQLIEELDRIYMLDSTDEMEADLGKLVRQLKADPSTLAASKTS